MATPTTQDIYDNLIAQLEANIGQTIPFLPKSFNRVICKALAAVFIIVYKYAGYNALQQFVRYASYQPTTINGVTFTPLIEWGRLIGVGDPIAATYAEFDVDLPVTLSSGSGSIAEGTLFRADENGATYQAVATVGFDSLDTVAEVRVRAVNVAGSTGNVTAGSAVKLAQPTTGLDPNGTRGVERVTGQDREAEEDYRRRVIDRFSKRPQGGSLVDYRIWGEEAGGVRCYPYKSTTLEGQIVTYVRSLTDPNGVPTTPQISAVLAYQFSSSGSPTGINDRKPVNANTVATASTSQAYEVNVQGLTGTTNQAEAEAAIISAVEEYFNSLEPYIIGLDVGPRTDRVSYFGVVGIVQEVVALYSGSFTGLTLTRDSNPVIDELLPRGTFATVTATVT